MLDGEGFERKKCTKNVLKENQDSAVFQLELLKNFHIACMGVVVQDVAV